MPNRFNIKNIRALLTEGFTDIELRRFCYDQAKFRVVYEQFSQNMGKDVIIDKIIDYAERKELFEILLEWAEAENPGRHQNHQPYYEVATNSAISSADHRQPLSDFSVHPGSGDLTEPQVQILSELNNYCLASKVDMAKDVLIRRLGIHIEDDLQWLIEKGYIKTKETNSAFIKKTYIYLEVTGLGKEALK